MGKAWKQFEKEVSEFFGATRIVRVSYDEVAGDMSHPRFSIECKYRSKLPKYLNVKDPTLLKVVDRRFVVTPEQFVKIEGVKPNVHALVTVPKKSNQAQFITSTLDQAKRYNPDLFPVACFKGKNQRGFICVWEILDSSAWL